MRGKLAITDGAIVNTHPILIFVAQSRIFGGHMTPLDYCILKRCMRKTRPILPEKVSFFANFFSFKKSGSAGAGNGTATPRRLSS